MDAPTAHIAKLHHSLAEDVAKCCRVSAVPGKLARMSSCHMRRSKGRDSLNFSISGSVCPVNLPPHNFLVPCASGATSCTAAACSACCL